MSDLTAFIANLTEGASGVITILGDMGNLFMEPPYVLVPIAAVCVLGYKVTLKIINHLKKA